MGKVGMRSLGRDGEPVRIGRAQTRRPVCEWPARRDGLKGRRSLSKPCKAAGDEAEQEAAALALMELEWQATLLATPT